MTKLELVLLRDDDRCGSQVVVRECPACHALVAEDEIGAHDRWHASLRRTA